MADWLMICSFLNTLFQFLFQYLSLLDELPSYMGGKENHWRQLTLEGMELICIGGQSYYLLHKKFPVV